MEFCVRSDLKGANVLLKSAPRTAADARGFVCKIADFGLSRVLGANRTHVSTNSHGALPLSCFLPGFIYPPGEVVGIRDLFTRKVRVRSPLRAVQADSPVCQFDSHGTSQMGCSRFYAPRAQPGLPSAFAQTRSLLLRVSNHQL